MAEERTYTIPLRKQWLLVPKYKRAKKAIAAAKNFLAKHMKGKDVRLGTQLNELIWAKGIRNPPHHVKVNVIKDEEGVIRAEIFGKPIQLKGGKVAGKDKKKSAPKDEKSAKAPKTEVAKEVEAEIVEQASSEPSEKKEAPAKKPAAKKQASEKSE